MSAPLPHQRYVDVNDVFVKRLPAHWKLVPFKQVIAQNDGGVWGNEPDGICDTVVLRSTEQTVDGDWKILDPANRKLTPAEAAAGALKAGDLLVTKSSGSALHIGKTTLATPEIEKLGCCYSNFMQRLRLRAEVKPRLAWYFMNSEFARKQFDVLANSTTGLANLNGTLIGQLGFPFGPLGEQAEILNFLDCETARIDALIERKTRFAGLLREKRQALITRAVTRGLEPDVPMIDSEVEWLGQLPAHWNLKPLKLLVRPGSSVTYGIVQPGESLDEGVPFLQTTNISKGDFDLNNLQRTTPAIEALYPRSRLVGGEVILGIRASIGAAFVVPTQLRGANLSRGIARIDCAESLTPSYLVQFLRSASAAAYWELSRQGSTFNEVSIETVRELPVPVPPMAEQAAISEFVIQAAMRIDHLIDASNRSMNLLTERRAALITAAVTGQIDLREAA